MERAAELRKYDVVIAGAGPAGCAAALALKDSGLKVALIDKQDFPRDKVCGDAIPGRAIKTLKSIAPEFAEAFKKFPAKYQTNKTQLSFKNQLLTFSWVGEAYTCARMEFDNFLFSLVKEHTKTEIYTNTKIDSLQVSENSITVIEKDNKYLLEAKLLIGADGAQSVIAKQLINKTLDRDHHVGSVRAYYSNVAVADNHTTEVYFDKRYLPSYLWIFPLPGNMANVGFGMLSSEIAKRKINIKKTFYDFINETPELAEKFKDAQQVGTLEGFGLPLGSKKISISGNRFMLAGDAASLIDPISGDGIGNAMLSGKLAADRTIKCFQQNDFSPAFIKQYDDALFGTIGSELKMRFRAQRMLSKMPFLLGIIFKASKNRLVKKVIHKQL